MRPRPTPLFASPLLGLLLFAFPMACGGGGGGGGASDVVACKSSSRDNGAPQQTTCFGTTIVASETNDYEFFSAITLPPVTVKAKSDLSFSWSGVTRDFLGHALTPASDLDIIGLMLWGLPLADLEANLNADQLYGSDLVVSPPPTVNLMGATSATLLGFSVNNVEPITQADVDTYFDPAMFPSSTFSYMVALQTGTDLGRNIRMMQSFRLDPDATATAVEITNASTKLECEVNLRSLAMTGVTAGTAALNIDWGNMHTNGLGATFSPTQITRAIVGHYTQSPEELEAKFLDLELIASEYYAADIDSGTALDFTMLKTASGDPFPGIDESGTWLLGLVCGNCRNPAPWYMTILKPCTM